MLAKNFWERGANGRSYLPAAPRHLLPRFGQRRQEASGGGEAPGEGGLFGVELRGVQVQASPAAGGAHPQEKEPPRAAVLHKLNCGGRWCQ